MKCYVYKMTADSGGAPCVENGLLTLAICKPMIRASAEKGDWIFGIGGGALDGRLIYIAQVTQKSVVGEYYRQHSGRRDRIYRWRGDVLKIRGDARYHTDGSQTERDVGSPPDYARANVLLSDGEFCYLGSVGKPIERHCYPGLAEVLDGLRQGHRVNHGERVSGELEQLRKDTFRAYGKGFVGEPSGRIPERDGVCSSGESRGVLAR